MNIGAMIAIQTAMQTSSRVACQKMRERQKQREDEEKKKKKEEKMK